MSYIMVPKLSAKLKAVAPQWPGVKIGPITRHPGLGYAAEVTCSCGTVFDLFVSNLSGGKRKTLLCWRCAMEYAGLRHRRPDSERSRARALGISRGTYTKRVRLFGVERAIAMGSTDMRRARRGKYADPAKALGISRQSMRERVNRLGWEEAMAMGGRQRAGRKPAQGSPDGT